ncbi:hypothetical protein LOD99_6830 [Oopsacas minuta]|uniref:Uncharacterized protein n=1 Tax=Oopsacas minuta TaxID=111878 RepID=A0AAV7JJT3_9METZ|nr:hypothetical protein LOD99_6830 [Oopsacas minuta]
MAEGNTIPTFHFDSPEDPSKLDAAKKFKLYSSISSISSLISTESQATFTGTTNELVTHLRMKHDEMQKGTFTRLCNKYLNIKDQITDLYIDFRDGLRLIKLLQKLSSETVAKPAKGNMRIHYMQNLNACVKFLIEHKVYLNKASISAENIAEGDERRTLGMIFMIFLRFQLAGTDLESQDYKGKKSALLLWCQHQTEGYPGVELKNFTSSWQDGLAFNALIHHNRPELIKFDQLDRSDPEACLSNAFNVAHKQLDIPPLLDAEDVVKYGDERSMFLYICSLYQFFNQGGKKIQASRKIHSVLRKALEFLRDSNEYENKAKEFVTWLETQEIFFRDTEKLKEYDLDELNSLLDSHKSYLNEDKNSKIKDLMDLFGIYTELLIRAKSFNFTPYQAPPGLIPQELDFQFEELTKVEHSYRLNLLLCIKHLKEVDKVLRRFNKRAKSLETQLKERNSEIPVKPSEDPATCKSQLDKLISLCSYFDTFSDRISPLENNITALKTLKYKSVQLKIEEKDEIESAYEKAKLIIQAKHALFVVNIHYPELKELYEGIEPRLKYTNLKFQGLDVVPVSEDPLVPYTEVQVFENVIDVSISQIIEHISTLDKKSHSLPEKPELAELFQSLLTLYKELRELINPTKDILLSLIEKARRRNKVNDPLRLRNNIIQITNDELKNLNSQFSQLTSPSTPKETLDYLSKIGIIRNRSLTIENRVEDLLSDYEGKDDLQLKSKELIDRCNSKQKTCLNNGWLTSLQEELDDIITHLTGVKGKVNRMNRQVNNGEKLGKAEIQTLTDFQQDLSSYPELVNSLLTGCPIQTIALPPCPDFTEQIEVKVKTQKIEELLNYTQPLITQLLKRVTEQIESSRKQHLINPENLKKLLKEKQKIIDELPVEATDLEKVKTQEIELKDTALLMTCFEETQTQMCIRDRWREFDLTIRLEAGKDYLEDKSKELDKIAETPSAQTETKFQMFQTEIEKFQNTLADGFESDLHNLDPFSQSDCEALKNEIDSECTNLYDRITDLSKKAKDREKNKKLMEDAGAFMELCDSLNNEIVLDTLNDDPLPTFELQDQVKNHDYTLKQVADQKPVYEKLINELYHSGNADGREKGKEVQKKWQMLQQTMADNSNNSGCISLFLKIVRELSPMQNVVDRLNLTEIPQLRNQLLKTPNFEETQVLSVKSSTLLELIKYISHNFNMDDKPPRISKYKSECNNLIGPDQTSRIFTPKLTHLENTISEALSNMTELHSLIKCWLKYYIIDRRATTESMWAKETKTGISGLGKRRLNDLTNWAKNMKDWVTENKPNDQYESFPDNIMNKIQATLEHADTELTDFIDEVALVLGQIKDKDTAESNVVNAKLFEDKLESLEDELNGIELADSLTENHKSSTYIYGLPNLLNKLEKEITDKHPGSDLLTKIPELKRQIEELDLKLIAKDKWLRHAIRIDEYIQRNMIGSEQLKNLIPIEKSNLNQVEGYKCKHKQFLIETKTCETFLNELSLYPDLKFQTTSFHEKFNTLKNSNEKLIEDIKARDQDISKREEILDSEFKLSESLDRLNEIEFIFSIFTKLKELSVLDEYPQIVADFVAGCDQNLELDAIRSNIVWKVKNLTEKLSILLADYNLEHKDKAIFLGVIQSFKEWLQQNFNSFNETTREHPRHSTVTILKYFGFVLTEVAPKIYTNLLEDFPSNFQLSEEVKAIWPLKQMYVSDNIQKMELSLKYYEFILYIGESAKLFDKIKNRIPKPSNFKDDIPLTKILPILCDHSLKTAESIYSENTKKHQALTSSKLTPTQSTELSTGMQTLSQSYHDLVETCRSVLLVAKSVVVRDPIVKTVRMLERGSSQLDEKIENIAKQDSLPDEHNVIEALLQSHQMACKDLPLLLAASRDPENSLAMDDIQEIQQDAFSVTKSLSTTKDVWSQTKALFSRKDMMNKINDIESECFKRIEKIDEVDKDATLDYWEKWCQDNIDKLLNMEISQPEVTIPDDELASLESSLIPTETYSISDFTIADPAAYDLDLSTQPSFTDSYNFLDSIKEEDHVDTPVPEETFPPISLEDNTNDVTIINTIEPDIEPDIEPVVDEIAVEVRVEQVHTFDISKLANFVYTQEPIDGDPARPSPVHRVLDIGDDSDDDSCYFEDIAIEKVFMSEDATYMKDGDEFAGLSRVHEVATLQEVPVVENAFDFKALLGYDTDTNSMDTASPEENRKRVSFTKEDVIIGFKAKDPPTAVSTKPDPDRRLIMQGFLSRKQEYISENRKPMKRPWKDVFVQLKNDRLEFYKDPVEMAVNNPLGPELMLLGALCEMPTDYTKKGLVFRVISATGASYLFQTKDSETLGNWFANIPQAISLCTLKKPTSPVKRTHSLDFIPTRQHDTLITQPTEEREDIKYLTKLQKLFPKK